MKSITKDSLLKQVSENNWTNFKESCAILFKANIDYPDANGHSLLWHAVDQERTDTVKTLLAMGANPLTTRYKDQYLFSYNIQNCGPTEISYYLYKANPNCIVEEDLFLLQTYGDDKMVMEMLKYLCNKFFDEDSTEEHDFYLTPNEANKYDVSNIELGGQNIFDVDDVFTN